MNKIRLTEDALRRIVKESVERVLDEAYNNTQYANLAGQASGALDSFGGKVKGFFNPKWKQRKDRQLSKFAKAATTNDSEPYMMKNDEYGDGAASYNKQNARYDRDYFKNTYTKDKNNPFQIRRNQYDDAGLGNHTKGMSDGEYYEGSEMHDIDSQHGYNDDKSKVRFVNSRLNNAFRTGRNAAMGKTKKGETNSGGVRLDGTGTNNGMFKHAGKGNY